MLLDPKWEKKLDEVVRPIDPWRKVLRDAADILERDGWTRGAYYRPTAMWGQAAGYCVAGAINMATGGKPASWTSDPVFNEAADKLSKFVGHPITLWNDDMAKDVTTVTKAMRACADAP